MSIWNLRKLSLILVLTPFLLGMESCMRFRTSDRKTLKELSDVEAQVSIKRANFQGKSVRYVQVGQDTTKPLVVFVHGAPGSSDAYLDYLKDSLLLAKTRMVSVDRLGYGYSEFGKAETSIENQAASICQVLTEIGGAQSVLMVGHSYGGPIIACMAMKAPEKVDGLVMLAPALDPKNEKIFWFSHLGRIPPFRWIAPRSLKVATDEKFTHAGELEKMLPDWKHVDVPVVYLHGDEDQIVPYENMHFIQKMLPENSLDTMTLKGENHFIPWSRQETVKKVILEQLEAVKAEH